MTLQEWLDLLEAFDPDKRGEISHLRAIFSKEELEADAEAEMTFRTTDGEVDQGAICLMNNLGHPLIKLEYDFAALSRAALIAFLGQLEPEAQGS